MGELDLTDRIPADATLLKVWYEMRPLVEGAELIARIWSGAPNDAVVIRGDSGEAIVHLGVPQRLWYQRPININLKLKLLAYKIEE
jgi:hypothetical protein